jgi:hypothetical protein
MKIISNICFECSKHSLHIHNHHVVPKVIGGTKTVPLCPECHGKVHNLKYYNHHILTTEGLKRARERGIIGGRPKAVKNIKKFKQIFENENLSINDKIKKLKISKATFYREKERLTSKAIK